MSAECSWLRSYETAEREGIWTIQSSIFPENIVSVQLHQRHGFREVGRRERIALMTYGLLARSGQPGTLMERRGGATLSAINLLLCQK
jgi:hypothetical protein